MKKGIVIVVLILCLAVGIYWAMDSQMFEKWLDMPDTKEESGENLYENEIGETQLFVWQPAEVYEGKDSLNEHLQYYYGILSADEQQIYGEIYTIMSEHSDYTKISTTDNSTIEKMMRYVLLDNPELFYVDTLQTELTTIGTVSTMKVRATENMSDEEQIRARDEIQNWGNQCTMQLSAEMSDYERALLIYEYVVEHIDYVEGAAYNQSLYSAVLGQSVCRGYASAFKYLCDKNNIPCMIVSGTMEGEAHAWNMVCIDGLWCHVDCTAGDDMTDPSVPVDYSWFGVNDEQLFSSHTPSEEEILPQAQSLQNSYYVRNSLYFYTVDENLFINRIRQDENFSFQCANEQVYEECRELLSTNENIGRAVGRRTVYYVGNNSTYTIFVIFQSAE